MPPDSIYIRDIIDSGGAIFRHLQRVADLDEFEGDRTVHQAVIRELKIIGEATKNLSAEFRDTHVDVPWKEMAGLRDILIHAYRKVDLAEVWEIVHRDLPPILRRLPSMLQTLEGST